MTQHYQAQDSEHQHLVARCHTLVAAIASRPGATKLLKGIVPTLEMYAGYKRAQAQRSRGEGRSLSTTAEET